MSLVFPGVPEVRARFLRLSKALIKDDLPTFDLPINAYSALSGFGHLR
jgi:hypothetical protein